MNLTIPASSKHALVIGGTHGVGKACVEVLSKNWQVVSILSRDAALSSASEDTPDSRVTGYSADVADRGSLELAADKIVKHSGPIGALVLCQRFRGRSDTWEGEIATCLSGTRNVIEVFKPSLDNPASIVMASSVASKFITPEQDLSYHVAKAGLLQLNRYFAFELGRRNVRVNTVSFSTLLKPESQESLLKDSKLVNRISSLSALGRLGSALEVAEVVDFLCSARASYLTGQDIWVDGGVSLVWPEAAARLCGG